MAESESDRRAAFSRRWSIWVLVRKTWVGRKGEATKREYGRPAYGL